MKKTFHNRKSPLWTLSWILLPLFLCPPAFGQCIQRRFGSAYSSKLAFLSAQKRRCFDAYQRNSVSPIPAVRTLFFTPGKSRRRLFKTPEMSKEIPQLSFRDNRRKSIAREAPKRPHTGTVLDLDSGYGLYHTFIGRLRHATQFKGAHYSLDGKWENTRGERKKQENILSASMNIDVDLSKRTAISLKGNYFQSDIDLPQIDGIPQHQKSSLELIANLKTNPSSDSFGSVEFSGERAMFTTHDSERYEMERLEGALHYRHILDINNTLKFSSKGVLERQLYEREEVDTKYYGTSTLIDSLALNNAFTIEAGLQFDAYHSSDFHHTENTFSPLANMRLRLFPKTSFYANYHSRLVFPDFSQLYIRSLYTMVTPGLPAERLRHNLEAGIQQAFGEGALLKIGIFYQEREHFSVAIDQDTTNILEYFQMDSGHFTGIRANVQMNYRERFVQNISYTYTQYDKLSFHDAKESVQQSRLPYYPEHHIQASLSWITPFNLIIDVNGIYVSEQYRSQQEQSRIEARTLLNIALTQKLTEYFQIYFLGRNLTDTDIYDMIPFLDNEEITSSRLFVGGLRLRF